MVHTQDIFMHFKEIHSGFKKIPLKHVGVDLVASHIKNENNYIESDLFHCEFL